MAAPDAGPILEAVLITIVLPLLSRQLAPHALWAECGRKYPPEARRRTRRPPTSRSAAHFEWAAQLTTPLAAIDSTASRASRSPHKTKVPQQRGQGRTP